MAREVKTSWNKETITELLARNDRAVERALLVVYARQTYTEQSRQATLDHNGVGFTGADAEIFTSFAQRIKRGYGLTPKQLAVCRKQNKNGRMSIAKYWRQLLEAIEDGRKV